MATGIKNTNDTENIATVPETHLSEIEKSLDLCNEEFN